MAHLLRQKVSMLQFNDRRSDSVMRYGAKGTRRGCSNSGRNAGGRGLDADRFMPGWPVLSSTPGSNVASGCGCSDPPDGECGCSSCEASVSSGEGCSSRSEPSGVNAAKERLRLMPFLDRARASVAAATSPSQLIPGTGRRPYRVDGARKTERLSAERAAGQVGLRGTAAHALKRFRASASADVLGAMPGSAGAPSFKRAPASAPGAAASFAASSPSAATLPLGAAPVDTTSVGGGG